MGAFGEDSASTGTFAPSDAGYQAALDDNSVHSVFHYNLDHDPSDSSSDEFLETEVGIDAGAAYVYRRSEGNDWEIEAFVKAPKAGDGDTLAVGASHEDGGALLQPVGGGSADAGNAVEHSGAAYLY